MTIPDAPRSSGTTPKAWPAHYEMINGWRGLAAAAVAIAHITENKPPLGHVAVMVFFVISGYCIAAAVQSSQSRGLSFWTFMGRRMRRIYPPYFFSLLFFFVTRLAKWRLTGVNQLSYPPATWIQTWTLTQWLNVLAHPTPYAFDNSHLMVSAHWTLGYEEQFYLVFALLMVLALRAKRDVRVLVLGLFGIALGWNLAFPRLSCGLFIDYWAHFAVGAVVFYRLCRPFSRRFCQVVDWGLVVTAILCGVLAWPSYLLPPQRFVAQEFFAVSVFALLLIGGRRFDDVFKKAPLARPFLWLGTITYSLYLTHQFNLNLSAFVASHLLRGHFPSWVVVLLQLVVLVLLAALFWVFFERPFLNKRLAPAPPAP